MLDGAQVLPRLGYVHTSVGSSGMHAAYVAAMRAAIAFA